MAQGYSHYLACLGPWALAPALQKEERERKNETFFRCLRGRKRRRSHAVLGPPELNRMVEKERVGGTQRAGELPPWAKTPGWQRGGCQLGKSPTVQSDLQTSLWGVLY